MEPLKFSEPATIMWRLLEPSVIVRSLILSLVEKWSTKMKPDDDDEPTVCYCLSGYT